jgi:hypothetical protein
MPISFNSFAIQLMFVSLVLPDKISSPIIIIPAEELIKKTPKIYNLQVKEK